MPVHRALGTVLGRIGGSVRLRSTLAAALVTGLGLLGTALVLVAALEASATGAVVGQAAQRAADVAARLRVDGVAALDRTWAGTAEEGGLVQVVDAGGRVVTATPEAGTTPVSALAPAPGQRAELRDVVLPGEDDPVAVAAVGVSVGGRDYVVLVAAGLGAVRDTVGAAATVLGIGLPVLLVTVAATAYALVGRALRPVEAIRAEVAAIEQADLSRRVPQPPGTDEIARLARTMNGMLARLERARDRQRRFVADASHELRSPLTTLRTHLDGAAGGRLDGPARAAMATELDRLARLVEDMLLLARADERGLPRASQELDLDDVLDGERMRLRRTTDLLVTASLTPTKVWGDRAQLVRLVRNLCDNAARYAHHRVDLSLRRAGDRAVIEVADDGPGVPDADRERVFGRFVRLDEARSPGGTGLGLAIVAEIAAAHGGRAVADVAPGGGALLRVELDLGSADPTQAPARGQPPSAARR